MGSVVTLIRCAARTRCNRPTNGLREEEVGMEDTETVERRGRTRGEKRDLTSKGVLKGPSCVEQKKGKERELGGSSGGWPEYFKVCSHCCALTSQARTTEALRRSAQCPKLERTCVINAPCPCTAKRYLILCCVAHGAGLYASTSKRPCSR